MNEQSPEIILLNRVIVVYEILLVREWEIYMYEGVSVGLYIVCDPYAINNIYLCISKK